MIQLFMTVLLRRTENYKYVIIPQPGSQTLVHAGLWRGRRECNTPAPHSVSRRWTPTHFPTCCPSSCLSASPSDGSGQFQAETQERLELLKGKGRGLKKRGRGVKKVRNVDFDSVSVFLIALSVY